RAELIDAILARQGGADGAVVVPAAEVEAEAEAEERPRRSRRGRRGGRARREGEGEGEGEGEEAETEAPAAAVADTEPTERVAERVAEGVVELLGNGSGFLRVTPPDPSDDDVYISAAQVRRCELVSGDRVSGP